MNVYHKISFIIPNLNSPTIGRTIESLLNQKTTHAFEIIIVGQDKFGIIEQIPNKNVQLLKTEKPTPPALARNLGAEISNGEYLIFIDSDCIALDDFLEAHLEVNNGKANRLVGGTISIETDQNYWTLSDNVSTFHEILPHTKPGQRDILPSLNLSLSKSLWNRLGGFDKNFPRAAGEDADFSYRAKKIQSEVIFTPKAKVIHLHRRDNLKSILKHAYTFGQYSIKINPKYDNNNGLMTIFTKYPIFLLLLSPIIAFIVIMKIVIFERLPIKYWHTLPVVKLSKIAWCLGAYNRIRNERFEK